MPRPSTWDARFIGLAKHIGQWSKDESTKVGCVIVGPDREIRSTGYNGFPRGVEDGITERHKRPAKYSWTEHSERNAIYNAVRMGTSPKGCILYYASTMPVPLCVDCARAIIQSGIVRVVGTTGSNDLATWKGFTDWRGLLPVVLEMMTEAKIDVVDLPREEQSAAT